MSFANDAHTGASTDRQMHVEIDTEIEAEITDTIYQKEDAQGTPNPANSLCAGKSFPSTPSTSSESKHSDHTEDGSVSVNCESFEADPR